MARALKILHVAEAFGGGLLQFVVELAEGSAADGHDVRIAYGFRPETPSTLRDDVDDRVQLQALPWTNRGPRAQLAAGRELRALLLDFQPDVVHLHSSFSGVVGALVVRGRAPTVFTPNAFASVLPEGSALHRRAYALLERWVCRNVTMVGGVSDSEADIARDFGAHDVRSVPNGIAMLDDENLGAPRTPPPGRPLVVAVGRTVPQRQPEACSRILAAVKDVADVVWLGGGGGDRGEAGKAALDAAGIEVTGWLPREELLRRMAQATVYLHFTAWDGLPFSILEAMALDVAVVASDIQPNAQCLGPGAVCATEAEAISLIRAAVTDPAAAEALRATQRERRSEFSAQAMVRRWHAIYDELTGAPGKGLRAVAGAPATNQPGG